MNAAIIGIYTLLLLYYNGKILRSPITGLVFWMFFLVINDILNLNPTVSAGVNIMLQDVVFCYFMYAGIVRLRQSDKFSVDRMLTWFTAMLFFIVLAIPLFSLLKGDSIIRSINVSRGFILFLPAFIYFFSFDYARKETEQIMNIMTTLAAFAALIVFGMQLASQERVVPSSGALFFAFAAVLVYARFLERGKVFDLILSLVLMALVVFLRHRSVWIALGLSLVFIHFYIKLNPRILALIVVTVVSLTCAAILFPGKAAEVAGVITESASPFRSSDNFENSTGGGRVARWTAQINSKFEWPVLLWGLGPGYERKVYMELPDGEKRLSTASFHNHYLEQMFRIGGISVLILFIFLFRVFNLNHRKQSMETNYLQIALCACIFGTLGFGMMYSFTFLMFIFLGITYSLLTIGYDEDRSDHSDIQPEKRVKKLALDAWKYEHA